MSSDVLIVGAGVAGLMTAIELADSGLSVQLFDAGEAGMESSWAGGGILSPIYPWRYPDAVNALVQWSTRHYPEFLESIHELSGIDPQLQMCGHLIMQHELSEPAVSQWLAGFPQQGAEQLGAQELRQVEPELNTEFTYGLWFPEIGQLRNPRFVKALKAAASTKSITIHEHTPVKEITQQSHRVTGIKTAAGAISADTVIITAGAWSGGFNLEEQPDIEPVKGQMILFQTEPGTIKRVALHDERYVIPRIDGKVLVGSTMEHSHFDKTINEPVKAELHAVAADIYPILKDAPLINHWAGLRPGNERQTPYVGQHPTIGNLYYNTGHYRNGIVTGLASARLCADQITGRTPILQLEPYALH